MQMVDSGCRWIVLAAVAALAGGAHGQALVDAKGDALAVLGFGPPLHDLDVIDVTYDESTLYFSMSFHGPIAAPSSGSLDAVIGLLELDVDQKGSGTGIAPLQNSFSPPFASLDAGIDFIVDLASEVFDPGFATIVDTVGMTIVGSIPVTYEADRLFGALPLAMIGDDGLVDFTAIMGSFDQPTDATDQIGRSSLIPAPPAAALLLLGLIARRRHRAQA